MIKNGYGRYLSETYDLLNTDIDYEKWADFYQECFEKYGKNKVKSICEMACGTGSMAIILSRRGYNVTAFDLSEDMLSIADKKARGCDVNNIRFTFQDMRSFKVYSCVQGIICMLDSLNCLTDNAQLLEAFESAYNALEDGGVFVFDVNSKGKFQRVYADNSYILEEDGVLLAWQNYYSLSTKKCNMYLSFFLEEEDGRYSRFDECIVQKMHTMKSLDKLLDQVGFKVEARVSGFDFSPADENADDRIFYICTK